MTRTVDNRYIIEIKGETIFKYILPKLDKDMFDFLEKQNTGVQNINWYTKHNLVHLNCNK
jgi:hypothetical protein